MRNADSRSGTWRSPRARQEGPAVHAALPADVQQGSVPAGLREHLLQPGSDDTRSQRRNRRRHVRGQDRPDHRGDAARAVPVLPGPPRLYSQEERETPPPRPAVMVRQAGRRSGPSPAGGDLRAAVFRPVARVPERTRMSHRTAGDPRDLDGHRVVRRG